VDWEEENYDKALENYKNCLKITTNIKGSDSIDITEYLLNIGRVYWKLQDYPKALEYYYKSL
jgi:tetratricopeptide (TPR) repeat protein